MRPSGRPTTALRTVTLERHFTKYAEGSVLVSFGDTRVLCNASLVEGVPHFLRGGSQGWLTAEYSMLPRATHDRSAREAVRGKQTGRTQEIQRLLGRALRAAVNLEALTDYTLTIDCDVLQADGGTRTAAITGACVAAHDALSWALEKRWLKVHPMAQLIAAVSVGIVNGKPVLDLDYAEDSQAETDMNVVMTAAGEFVEIQGTAEGRSFSASELEQLLSLAQSGIAELIVAQQACLD